jgi:hypothetical protein
VWATISAIASPLEVDECSRPRAANQSPLLVGLTLVLGRTSLSAAGLAVSSLCDFVALNATSAIGSLCWCASDWGRCVVGRKRAPQAVAASGGVL